MMRTIRQTNPQAEFLLVSTMRFDPAYTTNPEDWKTMSEYEARLRSMVAQGVQLVDMTAISGAVFAAKAPRDCLKRSASSQRLSFAVVCAESGCRSRRTQARLQRRRTLSP